MGLSLDQWWQINYNWEWLPESALLRRIMRSHLGKEAETIKESKYSIFILSMPVTIIVSFLFHCLLFKHRWFLGFRYWLTLFFLPYTFSLDKPMDSYGLKLSQLLLILSNPVSPDWISLLFSFSPMHLKATWTCPYGYPIDNPRQLIYNKTHQLLP